MLCRLWWNSATVHKSVGIFPMGIGVIHIPIYVHYHSFPFLFPSWSLIPIQKPLDRQHNPAQGAE